MAEQKNYPQIPAAIWWGYREMLINKPSTVLNPKIVSRQFSVQETAAKAYMRELQKLGMIDEDGKPSDIALEWRLDEKYQSAVEKIVGEVYPAELVDMVDLENIDKTKVNNWFLYDGLGSGSAGNKTATFAVIASPKPGESSSSSGSKLTSTKSKPADIRNIEKPKKMSTKKKLRARKTNLETLFIRPNFHLM